MRLFFSSLFCFQTSFYGLIKRLKVDCVQSEVFYLVNLITFLRISNFLLNDNLQTEVADFGITVDSQPVLHKVTEI